MYEYPSNPISLNNSRAGRLFRFPHKTIQKIILPIVGICRIQHAAQADIHAIASAEQIRVLLRLSQGRKGKGRG